MKTEKFKLRGKNSVCAGAFQLLRGRAPAQLRGNIGDTITSSFPFVRCDGKRQSVLHTLPSKQYGTSCL
jgi:hypothetical protein